MIQPIYTPRLNNNDDEVTIIGCPVKEGERINSGDIVVEVETDKAVLEVTAEHDGFALGICFDEGDKVQVGSILMWIGETPTAEIPDLGKSTPAQSDKNTRIGAPTAKAKILLSEHKLKASDVIFSGERLTVEDIEKHLSRKLQPVDTLEDKLTISESTKTQLPEAAGVFKKLTAQEHGMIRTVEWHRDHAVPAYMDIQYDNRAWSEYSQQFSTENKYMMSPLLALMAHRLTVLAQNNSKYNSTIVDGQKFQFNDVNLGFTIQVESTLYLLVVKAADKLNQIEFIDSLGLLQRQAMTKKINPENLYGSTIGFSSMARWNIHKHVPVLSPNSSLMIAHSASVGNTGTIGATYDHRVLNGSDVASLLNELIIPE